MFPVYEVQQNEPMVALIAEEVPWILHNKFMLSHVWHKLDSNFIKADFIMEMVGCLNI